MANVTGHCGFHGYCCYSDPIEEELESGPPAQARGRVCNSVLKIVELLNCTKNSNMYVQLCIDKIWEVNEVTTKVY